MFNHLVMLKKSPWYVYAANEADALETCEKYRSNVIGVVSSDSGIVFQEIKQQLGLHTPEVKMISEHEEENQELIEEIKESSETLMIEEKKNEDSNGK